MQEINKKFNTIQTQHNQFNTNHDEFRRYEKETKDNNISYQPNSSNSLDY